MPITAPLTAPAPPDASETLPILIAPHPLLKARAARSARPTSRGARAGAAHVRRDVSGARHRPGGAAGGPRLRVITIDLMPDDKPAPITLINPEIVAQAKELATREEGCLSLPGQYAEVTRPARVKVRYLDETGARREVEADGLARRLPAARDRPPGRRAVRRSPVRAEAQHHHAPARQGAAAEERGEVGAADAARLHGQPGFRRAGAAGAARGRARRSPRCIASRRGPPGAGRRCSAAPVHAGGRGARAGGAHAGAAAERRGGAGGVRGARRWMRRWSRPTG